MSKEIYFFLGPHKTATTSLQNLISKEYKLQKPNNEIYIDQNNFLEMGLDKNTFRKIGIANQKYLIERNAINFHKNFSSALKDLIDQVYNFNKIIIFNENIIGPMIGHTFAKKHVCNDIYPNFKSICEIINDLKISNKDIYEIKIILIRRNFKNWILSVAKDNFSKKLKTSEDEFLKCLNHNCATEFSNIFESKEGIYIYDFKEILVEPKKFFNDEIFQGTFLSNISARLNKLPSKNTSNITLNPSFMNSISHII
jgi:hypothetical protein